MIFSLWHFSIELRVVALFERLGGSDIDFLRKIAKKSHFLLEKKFFFIKGQILGRGGHVWATSLIRVDRSQIFEKFHDF